MMKILGMVLLIVSSTAFADNKDPITTATNYYEALSANNIKEARKYISDKENLPDDGTTEFDIDKYYFFNTSIDKNQATIKTSTVNKKGTLTYNTTLEKVNGVWKVNFQNTTINMMRGAFKKGQVGGKVELTIEKQ